MRILLFGASGMIGQGVLRECLLAPDVSEVLSVGRRAASPPSPKLRELVVTDLADLGSIEPQFAGIDACFYCMGVSSSGMSEADYRRLSYDMPMAAANALARRSPGAVFTYVTGAGTGKGSSMWARVKGQTENELQRVPLKGAYMFRPGVIQPLHGEISRTPLYRIFYTVGRPFLPLMRLAGVSFLTTEDMGRAMLRMARQGYEKHILEVEDIRAAALR